MLFGTDEVRVYLACKPVDMRLGAPGLCAAVKKVMLEDPFSGSLFLFRSRRGNYTKMVYFDGSGTCVFSKKMEHRGFVWPRTTAETTVHLTTGQLQLLLEGIDWRHIIKPEPLRKPEFI